MTYLNLGKYIRCDKLKKKDVKVKELSKKIYIITKIDEVILECKKKI